MQKKVYILLTLLLLIILASCSKETKKEQNTSNNFDAAKQKIKEINKLTEKAIYHAVYSTTQGNRFGEIETWQKENKLKSKLTSIANNHSITSISIINDEGVFLCQSKDNAPSICIKPKELQEKYSKRTTQVFRDEVLEKLNVTEIDDKTVAGEKASCFLAKVNDKFQEICYTAKGVMIYTKHNTKGEIVETTAKSIDYSVDDSQFKLEGELLEQT